MNVICGKPCKYKKAVFCGLEYTMLNQFGQCLVWFDRNGGVRRFPEYEYFAPSKQNEVKENFSEPKQETERSADEPKKDESKIENTEGNNENNE